MKKRRRSRTKRPLTKVNGDSLRAFFSINPEYVYSRQGGFTCKNAHGFFGDKPMPRGTCLLNSVVAMSSLMFPLLTEEKILLAVTSEATYQAWMNVYTYFVTDMGASAYNFAAAELFLSCCSAALHVPGVTFVSSFALDGQGTVEKFCFDDRHKLRLKASTDPRSTIIVSKVELSSYLVGRFVSLYFGGGTGHSVVTAPRDGGGVQLFDSNEERVYEFSSGKELYDHLRRTYPQLQSISVGFVYRN